MEEIHGRTPINQDAIEPGEEDAPFPSGPGAQTTSFFSDTIRLIRLTGFAFLFLFGFNVLGFLLPFVPFNPTWQLEAIRGVLGVASLPMIGLCLLFLAGFMDSLVPEDEQVISETYGSLLFRFRKLCQPAAVGFLLFVPLLLFAIVRANFLSDVPANQEIRQIEMARAAIRKSETFAELGQALAMLPGDARLAPNIKDPLAKVRQEADDIAGRTLSDLRGTQQKEATTREVEQTVAGLKLCGMSVFYFFLYASMGGMRMPLAGLPRLFRSGREKVASGEVPTITGLRMAAMEDHPDASDSG
jgi:hypothetical protein